MLVIKVLRHGQITLPKELREVLGVKEGDILEAEMKENQMVLKPKILIDKIPESEFELSEQGKKKIKEAFEDIKRGTVKKFDNVEDLIKDLNS
mgnify:FL=1